MLQIPVLEPICFCLANKLSYNIIMTFRPSEKRIPEHQKLFAKNVSSCETQLVVVFSTTQRFENSARIDCVQFLLGFYQSSFESITESKRTGRKKLGMDFR